MISGELYEEMVDYIRGRLDEVRRKRFEARLAEDPALQEELDWELLLLQQDDIYQELEVMVSKELPPTAAPPPVVRGIQFYFPLVAALLSGIILLGLSALLVNRKTTGTEIVINKPGTPKPVNIDTARISPEVEPRFDNLLAYNEVYSKFRTDKDLPEELANVQIAYAESDYRRVLAEAENMSPVRGDGNQRKDNTYSGFYKGLAYLELGNNPGAISAFNAALKESPEPQIKKEILWYKSLALLKSNRIAECRAILLQIAADKTMNKSVQKLLNKLPEDAAAR